MFAKRMKHIEGSGIRRIFETAARMKNPIDLSLGQAHFDVPDSIKEAAIAAIRAGKNRYTVTAGIPELRDSVTAALAAEGAKTDATMIVAGASGGLLLALLAVADEDTEVLVSDPCFATYLNLIRLTGATPRLVDTYPDFRLTPSRLEAAMTPRSRVFLFNTPVNPTGVAYTPDEVRALAATARKLGLRVISDEVYDRFVYDHPHECWLKHDPSALLVRAFSKTLGMPGWRVGYAAGPKDWIDHMQAIQQSTFVSVNTPAQWACLGADGVDWSGYLAQYRRKRDLAYEALRTAFRVRKPEGAFYIFPEAPGGDAEAFLAKCLKAEVLVVPSKAFSRRNEHIRISYAVDDDTLRRGLDVLVNLAK